MRGARGFTLIEVLVATLIAMTAVLGFSAGTLAVMKANRLSEKQSRAAAVGQALLADLRRQMAAGGAVADGTGSKGEFTISWSVVAVAGVPAGVTPLAVTVSWTSPTSGSLSFQTAVNDS